ncbi:phage tail protein [Paenibacillus pinisoli]|uniref:Phage tail protein n=1 Tax=Paenibacillus pinisoli TaxID=1276110 RepID=A0A3A6PLW0_9BACL|nr:tail fiber protein [Paenibacillus pinisoli]RJX39229.1 phage tail protein [Paenibacillus pinisoli]
MSDQYVGEIRMFAGNYAPQGWALCNGQLLSISQHEVLYVLLGTTYGGDGRTTFALPDLRGRVPIHNNNTIPLGSLGGSEKVTLTSQQLPAHTHMASATANTGDQSSPANGVWAAITNYSEDASKIVSMNANAVAPAGGSQAHDNMMPSTAVSFIIALEGIFPSEG